MKIERLFLEADDDDARRRFNAYLLGKWGLPDARTAEAIRAARYRDRQRDSVTPVTTNDVTPTVTSDPDGCPQMVSSALLPAVRTSEEISKNQEQKQLLKLEAIEVLKWLNDKTGKNFRPVDTNLDTIMARLKSGITKYQLKAIVSYKIGDWTGDPKSEKWLRPETLFGKTKCEQYLGELPKLDNNGGPT